MLKYAVEVQILLFINGLWCSTMRIEIATIALLYVLCIFVQMSMKFSNQLISYHSQRMRILVPLATDAGSLTAALLLDCQPIRLPAFECLDKKIYFQHSDENQHFHTYPAFIFLIMVG